MKVVDVLKILDIHEDEFEYSDGTKETVKIVVMNDGYAYVIHKDNTVERVISVYELLKGA